MSMALRRFIVDRRGVASVEFAAVALVFFMMLFAIIELGRLAAAQSALSYAADVAARYAAVHGADSATPATTTTIAAEFAAAAAPILGSGAPTPTVTFSPDNNPGSTVTVSASYAWAPLSMGSDFASVTLSSQSTLVIEH
jgi:Flp pilus assembly protein TadG